MRSMKFDKTFTRYVVFEGPFTTPFTIDQQSYMHGRVQCELYAMFASLLNIAGFSLRARHLTSCENNFAHLV